MSTFKPSIDFTGARGSNAGDQFHELWALQQVLDLLRPGTDLKAVGVEGVRTELPSQDADNPTWDGVDCTMYYGGSTLETADRIEFIQLKYSAANPKTAWSVARLTANKAKKGSNSVIRKMADDFTGAKSRMKQGAQFEIRLISNQDLAAGLKEALETRWSGQFESAAFDSATIADLKSLNAASGLSITEFRVFLETLDFSECGSHSRFAIKEKVVATLASLLGDDVSSDVRDLQVRVRELMLPERSREIVTDKDILLWFGLSAKESLFPCPPDIRIPENAVKRSAANKAVELLTRGARLVLVHGVGGCGKTTLIRQVADRLPEGSVTVLLDCFGGGRYLYSDDKRHLPENAFLHLANELAVALRLPLFIPRSGRNPANIKSFLAKLRLAGEAIKQLTPDGILLIVVDAADNSVVAANAADPLEHPFIFDLFGANLSALPENIHILASCRTARRDSLRLPPNTPDIICPPFTPRESKQFLEISYSNPSDVLVEQFHSLSNANPRVQAYAIATAHGDRSRLLEALLPGGKSLPDVLRTSFDNALNKLGQPQLFDKLVGVLAFLPAPIAVPSIARIAGCTEDTVRDFALDLAPGLRLHGNNVTIADEDFDVFIKDKGSNNRTETITDIAEDFIRTFQTDPYSSIHVADALIDAGRARDVLSVIERDPKATAIDDAIIRRQVQVRRLKLSLAACKEAGSKNEALKTVLISAEAERDESTLNEVLGKELDLSVEFAGSSLRRTILLDRDRVKEHGSFLAQDAVRAIRKGDRVTAREQLYFQEAWLGRRREIEKGQHERWTVKDSDISARTETILELAGPKAAFLDLMRWKPRDVPLRVAYILVPELIAAGKVHHIKVLVKENPPPGPWDLLLWVPLAMSGESVDGLAIEKSLKRIRSCFIPAAVTARMSFGDEGWQEKLLDTFITACEIAFKLSLDSQAILSVVNRILEALEGKQKLRLYGSDICRIDGLFRCWLLKQAIAGRVVKDADFVAYVKTLNPEPKPEKRRSGKRQKKRIGAKQTDNGELERVNRLTRAFQALFPVYSTRLEILSCARENQQVTNEQLNKLCRIDLHAYHFDYDHESTYLRDKAAQSVMGLLIVNDIEAFELAKCANTLAQGRFSDSFASHHRKIWSRMRLRTSEADKLVLLVAKAAEDIKGVRAASSDKLQAIIHLSRLMLPVSRDDAESLFNEAVGIAKEIDQEAFDQIHFVAVLAEHAHILGQLDRRNIAADIFSFVSGAAERLSSYDGFPWRSAVHALTCVDDATALASICRWADDGTVRIDYTLEGYLLAALQRGIITLEAATSLTILIDGSSGDLRKELVSRAVTEPQKYKEVIEELARETLLLSPKDSRLPLGQEIVDRIPKKDYTDGKWLAHLKDTVAFLRHITDNKTEKTPTIPPDKAPRLTGNDDLPKEFEFDPQGRSFTTTESIAQVLQAAKASDLRHNNCDLLKRMRDASSSPKERVPFLNALAGVSDELIWCSDRVEMILETVTKWKGTPAVDRWCTDLLPSVLVADFRGAAQWLREQPYILHQLLDYTRSDTDGRLRIILEGVAQVGEALSSRTLFAIAEEISRALDVKEAGAQLLWYAQRLRSRLPAEDQPLHSHAMIPNENTEAIARFLYALMSDIDTRVRWKAAHALRRLARLGCFDVVKATVSQSSREKEDAFRDPMGPFYFLAAKLWLTISLYRISAETPQALNSCKEQIVDLAISSELPHVGIREYAKRTLLQLTSAGSISLTASDKKRIDRVNTALKGQTIEKKDYQRSIDRKRDHTHRFKFDEMDTIPYWYQNIFRIFPTVSQHKVFEIAERWILDKWGADPEANWWNKEPRKARYDERRFGLWTHSHGSLPTIERYGTHLEWNAMHCVMGELLTTHPISKKKDYYDSFDYWLRRVLPTEPPTWLSDNRGPTPIELRLWTEDQRTDIGWLHNVRRDEFLTEVGLHSSLREGWIVVDGYYNAHFSKRETIVRINSALVSPNTAAALVRALQTVSNPWDFRIPDQDDELQINMPPYRLLGWLMNIEGDTSFDDHDPLRYGVGQIRAKPGRDLERAFGLVPQAGTHRTWITGASNEPVLMYEAWCDGPPPEEDYYLPGIRSDGKRLWARADMMQSFITNGGWDLICEVQIERRLRNEYGRSYETDAKKKTHDKILLLRADGSVADIKGRIGSWAGGSRRAGP